MINMAAMYKIYTIRIESQWLHIVIRNNYGARKARDGVQMAPYRN